MIAIVLTARTSYTKLKSLIAEFLPAEVHLYVCASALLPRYGNPYAQVKIDFPQHATTPIYSTLEGATLTTDAKETAILLSSLADAFARDQPRCVVVMADRHETLAASIAARYQNIPIAHLQGGETSGNVDDDVRWANSALATYHFPASRSAELALIKHGYRHVWNFGCPSIDLAKLALDQPAVTTEDLGGHERFVDPEQPFVMVALHPETERPTMAFLQQQTVLNAVAALHLPMIVFWPGQDAGAEDSSRAIREFKAVYPGRLKTIRSLPPVTYLRLLSQASCLVGNSSAGIRESSFLGVPVVNVGIRQRGREHGHNVWESPTYSAFDILSDTAAQIAHGPYAPLHTYGDGMAAPSIAAKLRDLCR